jgi:site-specific DNA recombinase
MYDYHALTGRMAAIAMEIKARRGELMFCPPVGYVIDDSGPRARAVPDPLLAPLVRETFELYATGEYSIRKLLATMTARGLVSRSGKPMGASGLHAMLTNPFYCGRVRWGGEVIDAGHEPLITPRVFDRVTSALKNGLATSSQTNTL